MNDDELRDFIRRRNRIEAEEGEKAAKKEKVKGMRQGLLMMGGGGLVLLIAWLLGYIPAFGLGDALLGLVGIFLIIGGVGVIIGST